MGVLGVGPLRSRAVDGRAHFGSSLSDYARRGLLRKIADRAGVTVPPITEVANVDPLPAIVHRDRWVVECPDCGSGAFVWTDEPLLMCAYCFNVRVGGKWRPVELPSTRERVEEILGYRAMPHERNWTGQSLAELRRENTEAGDPVPKGGAVSRTNSLT